MSQMTEYIHKSVPKTDDQKSRIVAKLGESFLFQGLDGPVTANLVDAMTEKAVTFGEHVIREGNRRPLCFINI